MNRNPGLQSCQLSAASCQLPASYRLRRIARKARAVIARVLGVPDYEAYVAHAREAHARTVPLSRSEFMRQRLDARYSKPGARCC